MPVLDQNDNVVGVKQESLALHYAALRGCMDCVRLLLTTIDNDFDANTQMDNDVTPVYLAAQEGHLDVLKFLVLEAGGSLYVRAADGMTPLHAASQMGYLHCVQWIVQEQQFDPNVRDYDGATPLHFAASRGHLDTVIWLMQHGARLSLDKFGKSPINDAAENKQDECLNVLVQYGTVPDYSEQELYFNKSDISSNCSCSRKQSCSSDREHNYRSHSPISRKSSENSFYLHPQSVKSSVSSSNLQIAHPPINGIYINPMTLQRNNSFSSSCDSSNETVHTGSSFYLHNPKDVIYDRVKNLFFEPSQSQTQSEKLSSSANSITVKVDVHSQTNSSSGAGSDRNLTTSSSSASSSMSETSETNSAKPDHEYEDIYMLKTQDGITESQTIVQRSQSQDSGKHSRSTSTSSSNMHLDLEFVHTSPKAFLQNGESRGSNVLKSESTNNSGHGRITIETLPQTIALNGRGNVCGLKRAASIQSDLLLCPPPPPPPLPISKTGAVVLTEKKTNTIYGKRLNSSCSDLSSIDLTYDPNDKHLPHLVNKKRVLPFTPPSFPEDSNQNGLIKPSEYLKSLNGKSKLLITMESNINYTTDERKETSSGSNAENGSSAVNAHVNIPKPPPPPGNILSAFSATSTNSGTTTINHNQSVSKPLISDEEQKSIKKQLQPLSAISIQDLNSVQLRKVEKSPAMKTFSVPVRSVSMQSLQPQPQPQLQSQPAALVDSSTQQKQDLINELKMARGDVTGLRKMKIEKAEKDQKQEKQVYIELSKQFTVENYLNVVPLKDQNGNQIPDWKRKMLAKKAAEKAKKEFAESLQREAEQKRLQTVPEWKKQLLAKKEEAEQKIRSKIYTPKVVDDVKIISAFCPINHNDKSADGLRARNDEHTDANERLTEPSRLESASSVTDVSSNKENEDIHIIPWRAHLRKTNSTLNLLS